MSLLEVARVGALAKSIRLAAAGGLILAAASLGGCGWQPLYGPTASGAPLTDVMRTVEISSIPGRVGQRVRNELIFKTTGGGEAADQAKYRLDIAVKESLVNALVNEEGDPKAQIFQLNTQFRLVRISDGEVVLEGQNNSRAAYDKVDSVFADLRARRDAEDRTARTIAEAIRTRLAAYFSTNA